MNLTFNHPEFEQEVRERLNIFDRELTVADAMLVKELDFTNFDFKDEDIESSKNTIISAIKASRDNPISVVNTYFSKVLVGSDSDEERIEAFNRVTKDEIIKVSKKVTLHTVLTLEPKEDEHGED